MFHTLRHAWPVLAFACLVSFASSASTPPVVGLNDAPVLDNSKTPVLAPVLQNAGAPVGAVGNSVASLVDYATPAGQVDNVTDLDVAEGDPAPGPGIAITAANATNGTWYYTTNSGTIWSPLGSPSAVSARLLAADAATRVYFQPNAGFSGTVASALTFRAWDQTSGSNGGTASTSSNGGTTAYSSATDEVAITVNAGLVFRSASTAVGSGALVINTPAGTVANDLLVAAITIVPSSASITTPSGWTLVRSLSNASGTTNKLNTYYRIAGTEPPSYTWSLAGSSSCVGGIMAWINADPVTPIDVETGLNTPSGLAHIAPSVTTTVPNTRLLSWHAYSSAGNWTPPAGMTEAVDIASSAPSATGVGLSGNWQALPSTGATGTRSAVASSNADVGNAGSMAIRTVSNTAPVLDATKNPALANVNEDAGAPAGAVGTLVSNLVDFTTPSGQVDNVSDADAGALLGIAITAANTASGVWYYSTNNGGSWNALGSPTSTTARLLAADAGTRLYFQPNTNYSGTLADAVTFRAWDQTSGANGSTASTLPNEGSTAFSGATDVAAQNVSPVNDPPQATNLNAAESYTEDTPVNLVDILVNDVDNTPLTVTLTLSNTAAGALNTATSGAVISTYSNGTGVWSASGAIADLNVLLANLVFTPAVNFNGSFTIATNVSDGVAAPITGAKSFTGTPTNDAPVLNTAADPTMNPVIEDAPAPSGPVGTLVSALVNLNPPAGGLDNVTDVDAGALTGLAIVMVNDFLGTAYYSLNNGTNWSAVGPVNMSVARTLAADANTRVYFAPVADLSGGITPFSFVAWDQTTGTNGGLSNANGGGGTSAFSAASDELYMVVTAVNDAPQATNLNAGETYAANTPLNLIDIVVSDVDHVTTNVSLSLSNTTAGSLNTATSGAVTSTYNSGTGVWSASGAIADVNTLLAGLTFTPAPGFNTDFTIAVQVSDGVAAPLSGSKLMTGPGAPVIAIIPHVVLEGSYNASTGLMNGAMRAAGLVPVTEPYTALGYTYTGTVGGSTTPAVLAVGGADAVHDWVIVELRSAANPATIVYSRAALIQRDGQVCDVDGVSPVTFGVAPGNYYLAVRHRNHLGAMTAAAIGYTATPSFVDMAAIGFPCYGTEAQKTISGTFPAQALWAGDVSFNGGIKYTGSGNDRDPILIAVGSTTPNNTPGLYSTTDVNLDGVVKYTGSGNDRDPVLVNVGSTTPNNVRTQQLP